MLNPEVQRTIDTQVHDIFTKAFPEEARFHSCGQLIGRVKKAYEKISNTRFDVPGSPSNMQLGFVVGNKDTGLRYDVTYVMSKSKTSYERVTITKNRAEHVRIRTAKLRDGTTSSMVEYSEDAPEFKNPISDTFETNVEMAEVLVADLVDFIKSIK